MFEQLRAHDLRHRRGLANVARARCAIALIALVFGALACTDVNTDPKAIASISIEPLPSPSIVANDSLRDSLGIVRPVGATVYNIQGDVITGVPIRFLSPDSGVKIDSTTGVVTADTARPNAIRLVAQAGGLQSAADTAYIVPRPDTIFAVNARDSLLYSLSDSTLNVSNALTVQLAHRTSPTVLDAVRGYLISYAITYPADTVLAQLLTRDGARPARVDTTGLDGVSGRRVRIRPIRLTATRDSVVVVATVRFRGSPVVGAPIRLVLLVGPRP